MALSLGENQSVAKDDGRWSLQPITEWLRAAEGTNQGFTQKLKTTYLHEVYAATYGSLQSLAKQTVYTLFFKTSEREKESEWESESTCVSEQRGFHMMGSVWLQSSKVALDSSNEAL